MRPVLGALGVALSAYGGWLLVSRSEPADLVATATWLAVGVLLHDVVLSGLVLAAGALGSRLLPEPARAPAAVALVVLGSVTLVAVPVLGRFGALADNPTLLDRPYVEAWLALVVVAVVAVAAAGLVRSRRGRGEAPGGRDAASRPPRD